jgi:tripartite-type tricarboxylate transporter receptor subunit TctC
VGWFALLGPKGLPADLALKVNKDMTQALANPDVVAKYRDISLFSTPRSQGESVAFLKSEVDRWAAVIKKIGLEPQ